MTPEKARELLQRHQNGSLSQAEEKLLNDWYNQFGKNSESNLTPAQLLSVSNRVRQGLPLTAAPVRKIWPRIAAAASILLVAGIGLYLHFQTGGVGGNKMTSEIKPGSNGAILTLSNGRQIQLGQANSNALIAQNGASLQKSGDSLLTYRTLGDAGRQAAFNTLETPAGRQFQVVLPDGSKVWLNAQSSLKYPVVFNGKDRTVELKGEAYFVVAHNAKQPFRVHTATQTITDIGTEFNVNSYADETTGKTTLVSGLVQVNAMALKPGEQAITSNASTMIRETDTDEETAWKNGNFMFDHTDIRTAMRQLARWYNVTVKYEGNFADVHYSGIVPRRSEVGDVLKMMKETGGTNFRIEGKTIVIEK